MLVVANTCRRILSTYTAGAVRGLSSQLVETSSAGSVGIITLNDPSRLNALTVEMGEQFSEAVEYFSKEARDQRIRSIVVTGSGDRAFSAGGDVNWLQARHSRPPYENSLTMVEFYNRFLNIRKVNVPTVCAINGSAIGAGMCMTLACDIRVAAKNAQLGFTFTKLGIHPGMGASLMLPRVVSQEYASYLLLSGAVVPGSEAASRGLVLEAVEKSEVLNRAIAIAVQMGENSPIAVQSCLQTLRSHKFLGLDNALLREADTQAVAYASQDFLRGIDAVRNKHSPRFEGWAN